MKRLKLSEGKPGCTYTILEIADEKRLQNRVSSMGLMLGGRLEVCQNLKKQPVLIFARDTLIAIGREESEKIIIGPADSVVAGKSEKIVIGSADSAAVEKNEKIVIGPADSVVAENTEAKTEIGTGIGSADSAATENEEETIIGTEPGLAANQKSVKTEKTIIGGRGDE